MNNPPTVTIVSWETRNWRHRQKAMVLCKNYGLKPVTKHIFIGELFCRERVEMSDRFRHFFVSKTDKFFFATMCKSCFNDNMLGLKLVERIDRIASFELIQMPLNDQKHSSCSRVS